MPLYRGGSNEVENLALACDGCNTHKWTHIDGPDPLTSLKEPLFNPRLDEWDAHFEWDADFTQVFGLTPVGRATSSLIQLNRTGLVNIRKALFVYGVYPQ